MRSDCPFCNTRSTVESGLCRHCARFAWVAGAGSQARSWTDVFYMFRYPPAADLPRVRTQAGQGAVERVEFGSGEWFELASKDGVPHVRGLVMYAGSRRGAEFEASVTESRDSGGRLIQRELRGEIDSDHKRYLAREINYSYEGPRLTRISVSNWLYPKRSDREKAPAAWVHHDSAEIELLYQDGRPSEIRVSARDGARGLRGELENKPTQTRLYAVVLRDGVLASVAPK